MDAEFSVFATADTGESRQGVVRMFRPCSEDQQGCWANGVYGFWLYVAADSYSSPIGMSLGSMDRDVLLSFLDSASYHGWLDAEDLRDDAGRFDSDDPTPMGMMRDSQRRLLLRALLIGAVLDVLDGGA
jgi:hypothetical protein